MVDLRGLLVRLAMADFPFVVVGGYAAFAHGATRLTQDLDVCCEFTEDSLRRLEAAIGDLHPVHRMRADRMPLVLPPGFSRGLRNLYLDTDLGQLDLLGHIKGIGGYAETLARSESVEVEGVGVKLLTLDGVIEAKEAMGRDHDREAARQLRAINNRKSGRATRKQ